MSDNTLGRSQIYASVHMKVGLSRAESADLVEMVIEEIIDSLILGEEVKLTKFGTFTVRTKREKKGRNFKTKEFVTVPSRRVTSYRPSQHLSKSINDNLSRKRTRKRR